MTDVYFVVNMDYKSYPRCFMVTLIEGRIGSGKTYFAVREVLYSYYRFDMDKVHWSCVMILMK